MEITTNLEILKLNYDITNREYIKYFKEWLEQIEQADKKELLEMIQKGQEEYELLMESANEVTKECQNGVYLKDVQYKIMDGIFFFSDLKAFAEQELWERFKLRVMNYIRRDQVNQLI